MSHKLGKHDFLLSAKVPRYNTDILMSFLWFRFTVHTLEIRTGFLRKAISPLFFSFPSSICQHPFKYLYEVLCLKQIKQKRANKTIYERQCCYCSQGLIFTEWSKESSGTPQSPKNYPHFFLISQLDLAHRIFATDKNGLKSWPTTHQLAMRPWASSFDPLSLNFFICVMENNTHILVSLWGWK